MQGGRFKFPLTIQGIAIEYIIHTFLSSFIWLKTLTTKSCKKFMKAIASQLFPALKMKFFQPLNEKMELTAEDGSLLFASTY